MGVTQVAVSRYEVITQEIRTKSPRSLAIGGSAVATMVWSSAERNIASMAPAMTTRISDGASDINRDCRCGACQTLAAEARAVNASLDTSAATATQGLPVHRRLARPPPAGAARGPEV